MVRRRLGDLAGALEDFHEAVRRDPQDVRSWFECGELHTCRQEYGQAIEDFSAILYPSPRTEQSGGVSSARPLLQP
ncbi:MAG: hypothetical protein ACYC3I_18995 [Gemmataceae bacterium]